MKHGSLFSGIGGFDLAAEWMGWENVFHCEKNSFGRKVLSHYWPESISYEDITTTDFTIHRGSIDILTGGFPCQPFSQAGKRKGTDDDRHLWPEMLRAIREIKPTYVVGENVRGLLNWNEGMVFDQVQIDLEAIGYEVQPFLLPACAVNAPHRRDRIWFIAYACGIRRNARGAEQSLQGIGQHGKTQQSTSTNTKDIQRDSERQEVKHGASRGASRNRTERTCSKGIITNSGIERFQPKGPNGKPGRNIGFSECNTHPNQSAWKEFPTQPPICFGNDGLSSELDGITFPKWRKESIAAAGNAIVPQVCLNIFKAIQELSKAS